MALLNYTTKIDAAKTVGEIQKILMASGCRKIMIENDAEQNVTSISFSTIVHNVPIVFSLPCNWEGVLGVMTADKTIGKGFKNKGQAIRVTWRIIKDWVAAQLALIQAGQAKVEEVYLPYAISKNGKSIRENILAEAQIHNLLETSDGHKQ